MHFDALSTRLAVHNYFDKDLTAFINKTQLILLTVYMRHAYHWLTMFHQIAGLTMDEKVSITTGVGWMNGRCIVSITSPPLGMSFS